uniref:Uncharacterized protein n=1 Tax=Amphimedon queenslandica TaxID=400682 RepID=A0A1X7SRJ4_AMPQE
PLSAADYIEICKAFNTIFIQDIPCITNQMRTQGRRFITLIDTLYDHKVCELTIYCVTLSLSLSPSEHMFTCTCQCINNSLSAKPKPSLN